MQACSDRRRTSAASQASLRHASRMPSGVPAPSGRQVSTAAQSTTAHAETAELACDDPVTRQQLGATPLWEVLLVLAHSNDAAGQLHELHSFAAGESRLIQQLAALQTHVCGLHVVLSSQRKFDCLLIVNLHQLLEQVQAAQRELDCISRSRWEPKGSAAVLSVTQLPFGCAACDCLWHGDWISFFTMYRSLCAHIVSFVCAAVADWMHRSSGYVPRV